MIDQEELPVTPKDICRMLRISNRTLITWSNDGHVRRHKVGHRAFYFKSEVLEDIRKAK